MPSLTAEFRRSLLLSIEKKTVYSKLHIHQVEIEMHFSVIKTKTKKTNKCSHRHRQPNICIRHPATRRTVQSVHVCSSLWNE